MKKMIPLLLASVVLVGCAGERPSNLGAENGRLLPCPESPNCVSSYESSEQHGIAALDADIEAIAAVLSGLDEAEIIIRESDYLYAEFTSSLMRYVDDVEFLYDSAAGVTQLRSASRLGHSDLGANRDRIESIRAAL